MLVIDRSRAILTGLIFAAVYVILLCGFAQETIVLNVHRPAATFGTASSESRPVTLGAPGEKMCEASLRRLFQIMAERSDPLTFENLERALREMIR